MAAYEVVAVEGLKGLDILNLTKSVREGKAAQAINRTLDTTRTEAARRIRQQVALPASYVSPSGGRLAVVQRATPNKLEGIIRARHRVTSLARFMKSVGPHGRGVTVEVKPGRAVFMRNAFLFKLRSGSSDLDTAHNVGLAMRVKKGQSINKKFMKKVGPGVYLLYGPSVDQVFKTVREDAAPGAAVRLEEEFLRLIDLGK